MKKIFSFLTAILASVTLASALEITVPATTLDLQNPTIVETAGWTGETAYYLDDEVLIVSGYEAYKSVAKQTWITFLSTGSSSSTWKALAPFKGSDYYTNKNYATLQSNRYTAYLVTNCDSVWAYGCNNAATAKYLVMNVYEITGEVATINTESVEPTYSVSNEAAGKADVVLKQALDATKKYLVVTTGAGASNSRSYETAFFRHPDATPKTSWTVAGSSATVFGTAWDPTNKANDMKKQADGSYKWEKTELELAAGSVDFKVCKDHAWDEAYPASNYNLAIAESGIYTITITFEPENSNKVSAVATKTGSLVVLPEVKFHGNFFGTWADTDPFTAAEDKLTAELTLSLTEGTYEFGCKFDGTWKANGATLTREAPATSLAEGSGNMKLVVDQAGDYVFTYTFLGEQLAVTYPKKGTPGAYTLTFNGTGTSSDASSEYTKDGNIFTDDCKAYVASVDTISKVYAARIIAENTSSLKFGTSSVKGYLEFTLATPVEVDSIIVNATQYGNNAAEVTVNGVKFDLTAGNKKPQDCKLVPNGIVSKITIAQTGSERIYLRYVTIYAKTTPTPPTPATLPVVALAGTMNGWSTTANVLVAAEDSLSASVKIALEAGRDTFKIVSDGKWLSLNGEGESLYAFHRDWTSASHINGIDLRNFELTADVAGEYTFTWTYADSTLTITFPEPVPVDPTVAVKGSMNNWGDSIPFVLAQDKKSASLTANIKKGNYEFKMIINGEWRSNGYTYHRDFPGCAGITANVEANMVLQLDVDGDYTFTWNFENDSLGIVFPNKPIPVLENGYYLVGDKYDWTPAATRMFVENTNAAGEYILADITLAADDSLKVVKVEDDEIITWYPGGDNYVVDAKHAGVKTIYFRPDGQGGEDWYAGCIYVTPNEMTAITNVNADAKAVKSLKNGILMIEKDGKVYNVIGLQIR